jgi:hypothetical protein
LFQIHGLSGHEDWNYGYDCSYWNGIFAKELSHAISYGQILRELTHEEYRELANLYFDKLCSLDLQFIENKVKKEDENN